jgi:hypothetical protein
MAVMLGATSLAHVEAQERTGLAPVVTSETTQLPPHFLGDDIKAVYQSLPEWIPPRSRSGKLEDAPPPAAANPVEAGVSATPLGSSRLFPVAGQMLAAFGLKYNSALQRFEGTVPVELVKMGEEERLRRQGDPSRDESALFLLVSEDGRSLGKHPDSTSTGRQGRRSGRSTGTASMSGRGAGEEVEIVRHGLSLPGGVARSVAIEIPVARGEAKRAEGAIRLLYFCTLDPRLPSKTNGETTVPVDLGTTNRSMVYDYRVRVATASLWVYNIETGAIYEKIPLGR